MGNLLNLLGNVTKKVMHKNEQESKRSGKSSFAYAWVLDETEEERSRGVTIDVGQYCFETPKHIVNILDAPGHKDFIPNMISGATKADAAVLVVDATSGEFETGFNEGGQTQEHTMLLRSLGISNMVVAINKLDNAKFSQTRYDEIVEKMIKFVRQAGFREGNVHYVPCSGLHGDNLVESSKKPELSWYKGKTLVEIVDDFEAGERNVTKPFRMAIHDIFRGVTSKTCVSGKIDAGFVEVGSKLIVMPSSEIVAVKCKFSFKNDLTILILLFPLCSHFYQRSNIPACFCWRCSCLNSSNYRRARTVCWQRSL